MMFLFPFGGICDRSLEGSLVILPWMFLCWKSSHPRHSWFQIRPQLLEDRRRKVCKTINTAWETKLEGPIPKVPVEAIKKKPSCLRDA